MLIKTSTRIDRGMDIPHVNFDSGMASRPMMIFDQKGSSQIVDLNDSDEPFDPENPDPVYDYNESGFLHNKIKVGILCSSEADFLAYLAENKQAETTYYSLSKMSDCTGHVFNHVLETNKARNNSQYSEMFDYLFETGKVENHDNYYEFSIIVEDENIGPAEFVSPPEDILRIKSGPLGENLSRYTSSGNNKPHFTSSMTEVPNFNDNNKIEDDDSN